MTDQWTIDEGRAARTLGRLQDANPYARLDDSRGHELADLWDMGWRYLRPDCLSNPKE